MSEITIIPKDQAPENTPILDIEMIVKASHKAFLSFGWTEPKVRAALLRDIAARIEGLGEDFLRVTSEETHLPLPRLTGERARACNQMRMFADLIESNDWMDERVDAAIPDRPGGARPEIRRTMVPLGPVAVFGASNFPYAFSVIGGDVASALAAGCPVIFKAHPGHPKTTLAAARVIREALTAANLSPFAFSVVWGEVEEGAELVQCPEVMAVGFTGSQKAGRALFDLAAARPRPIPVYAEMGSVNPVFFMPGALQKDTVGLAKAFAQSLTLGVGQFCTNPGVVIGLKSPEFDAFLTEASSELGQIECGKMLTESIQSAYLAGVQARGANSRLEPLCKGEGLAPSLFSISAAAFVPDLDLHDELFGPSAIAVHCDSLEQMMVVATALEGQLTASIHFVDEDKGAVDEMLPYLTRMAGRVIANGFPTGVEVCSAMQHGGPYPATTDSRSTSVGTAAIQRFVRPVAFQNF